MLAAFAHDDDPQVARSLRASIASAMCDAVMVGASESYLSAMAVALGHRDGALALLTTVPLLCGAIAQLVSKEIVRTVGGRKRLVTVAAGTQAAVHIALVCIALFRVDSFAALFVTAIAYWVSGLALAPAWNSWLADLTSRVDRTRFFAWRSAIAQVVLLAAYAGAGFVLDAGRHRGVVLVAFAALFAIAGVSRAASAALVARLHDPRAVTTSPLAPLVARLRGAAAASRWRVAVFVAAFMFGANVAIPFFAPYMLRTLELDFVRYMSLTAIAIAVKAVAFPIWSRVAHRLGLRAVLLFGTFGAAVVAALWGRVHDIAGLHAVQALSGVSWSAYELASFQLLLRSAPDEHRESFFSLQAPLMSLAQVCGGLCGALLLRATDVGYEIAFVASSFLRAAPCALLLAPVVTALSRTPIPKVFFRGLSLRPDGGMYRAPIVDD
jgi:MFS family permease